MPPKKKSKSKSGRSTPASKKSGKEKRGRRGKKKGNANAFFTSEDDTLAFGFRAGDIIRTPLGLICTVIGVKYTRPGDKESGQLWVEYEGEKRFPLERDLGYSRCGEADHIWRDVMQLKKSVRQDEDLRNMVEAENKRRLDKIAADESAKAEKAARMRKVASEIASRIAASRAQSTQDSQGAGDSRTGSARGDSSRGRSRPTSSGGSEQKPSASRTPSQSVSRPPSAGGETPIITPKSASRASSSRPETQTSICRRRNTHNNTEKCISSVLLTT
ncbi:hypothetical protein CBR_g63082 [Chara braunii]|uniref:Uncharacterized protein n=1 Tax=Chara braunii TaxID=69332 RepID=A0A388K904_CHABU|nr:hypothetical protein CBR_g63082 [Chara braunii]|eukprot:GBG66499.1 hypothetical protein CBR_g63082 [Chara braunii]